MLIGYEVSHDRGPVVLFKRASTFLQVSYMMMRILMLTSMMQILMMTQKIDEVFKRTVVKLKKKPLMKLSEIEDFDELRFE